MKRLIAAVFWWILASCLFVACQSRSGASTLLAEEVCTVPCWNSITPGLTQYDEALRQLRSLSDVRVGAIAENYVDDQRSNISADFTTDVRELGMRIYFIDQLALALKFDVRNVITVGQIVEITGEPDYVYSRSGCADSRWLSIGLLNLSKGAYIEYFDDNLEVGEMPAISLDSLVYEVTYFQPSMLDEVLGSYVFIDSFDTPNSFLDGIQAWDGFGEVDYVDVCE